MAEAVVFGIAEEVLKILGSEALVNIASVWGFKAQLQKLRNTINTIKNKLLDAEERHSRPDRHDVREWLERLRAAVYAADDLFDEFNTVAIRKQLMSDNKLTREVRTFFSRNNQMAFAFRISRKIKSIREKIDGIVKDSTELNFVARSQEERRLMSMPMRDQTHSFSHVDDIIGRDDEKKVILDMLLAEEEQLSVIPILGMGGMGKTALAQLLFNDPQVTDCFGMRLWVCISDIFNIKEIIEKILKSATNKEIPNLEMEQLQLRLREQINGKKYLLVLDDVWNEKREEWLNLMALLKVGGKGSKIMVTTRLRDAAKIMGTFDPFELKGLEEEKSWEFFTKMAFNEEAQQNPQLVKIGKEIVNKCGKLPLAIRTIGSLLYRKEERYWCSFKDKSLAILLETKSDIMSILRLSYHHLWSPLKNCFAYCSLFPKDSILDKEMLKDLWIAEGFIIPEINANQSLDEAAEEYFQTLHQRCFFQDIVRNEWDGITGCKMHDLMHDLAQQEAGVKCKVVKSIETHFDDKVIHLSFADHLTSSWEIPNGMLNSKLLRTFLLPQQRHLRSSSFNKSICQQLTRLSCLRVLDLHGLNLKSLPRSIGKLIHLRYLNLSFTNIEKLPDSVTKLHNLQTLICSNVIRTLPENIRKLAKLRSLDVQWAYDLSHLPSGLAKLTSLNRLPKFIVCHKAELKCKPKSSAKLSDLKELNNLRGDLRIEIYRDYEKNMLEEAMEANLTMKQGLTKLKLRFPRLASTTDNDCNHDEDVLEGLKPHSNLRKLWIVDYKGQKLPSWARRGELCITLPYLVVVELTDCSCEHVPEFSQLLFLKRLYMIRMDRVEYMEDGVCNTSPSSSKSQGMQTLFFPSLELLGLYNMKNLKGWWKGVEANESPNTSIPELVRTGQQYDDHQLSMQFPKLSTLYIEDCPELKYMPHCPKVKNLKRYETEINFQSSNLRSSRFKV